MAALTPLSTSLGFSPRRISTMPSTLPDLSFTPKIPVCGVAPILTRPMSRMKTGMPLVALTTMFSMSAMERINPTPRTTIPCWRLSIRAPPAFLLLALTA